MSPDRIKISEEFHIGKGLWLSVECPIVLGEDPVEEFKKARSVLHEAFNSMNQSGYSSATDYNTGQKEVEDAEINNRFEEVKKSIVAATTKEEATQILQSSEFKLNLSLKAIVNSKS
jgi:hypothetical protein